MKKYRFTYKNKMNLLMNTPSKSGIYWIYLNNKLIKIGKTNQGLRRRFGDYLRKKQGNTQSTNKLMSRYIRTGKLSICYQMNKSPRNIEKKLLSEYKTKYGNLPLLNKKI